MVDYVVKSQEQIESVALAALMASGADHDNGRIVAHHLALADASGMGTHGIVHLPGYVEDVRAGRIAPSAKPSRLVDASSVALIHGGWTFGQVAALEAIRAATEKAAHTGVAISGLVGCHHIGRLGHFVEYAAEQGFASMIWAGGYAEEEPHVAPHGGQDRVLGTNPIAFGFPGHTTPALTFDFATTAVAGMKVVGARRRGEELPAGSIIGPGGVPTTDPRDFFAGGAHVPFGGHKGFAISLAAEWLGRMLTCSDQYAEPGRGSPILGHQGVLFVAFKLDAFGTIDQVLAPADEMYRRIANTRPAPGFARVLLPGQLEAESRGRSLAEGISMEASVWEQACALAGSDSVA
jgi:LDH2 family malate/lactate/ureidoglycolate dehydrogenase